MYVRWSFTCLQVCQWLAIGPCTPISSTNKTDRSEKKPEILLKMAINKPKTNVSCPQRRLCDGSDIHQFVQWHISCFQSPCDMSATMFGSFVFIPVYCIPRFCFIWFFLIIYFCSCYVSLSKCYSCCLIETRRVLLVGQGLFSLSYHMNYHLDCSFFFLCNVMSVIVRPVSCVPNVVSVSELSISNCSFGFL